MRLYGEVFFLNDNYEYKDRVPIASLLCDN